MIKIIKENIDLENNEQFIIKDGVVKGFRGNELEECIIPYGVREIGYQAFYSCKKITKVFIPETVTLIGVDSFSECTSLQEINLPKTLRYISNGAFSWCESLKSIYIPKEITSIPNYAFSNCTSLSKVIFSESIQLIGEHAFSNNIALKTIKLPNNIKVIEAGAFAGCTELNNIFIPNTVKRISSAAFYGCTKLTNIYLPDELKEISADLFRNCVSLERIELPNSIQSIQHFAFYNCKNLKYIKLRNNSSIFNEDIFIGEYAFKGCYKMANKNGTIILGGIIYGVTEDCTEVLVPQETKVIEGLFICNNEYGSKRFKSNAESVYFSDDEINIQEQSLPSSITKMINPPKLSWRMFTFYEAKYLAESDYAILTDIPTNLPKELQLKSALMFAKRGDELDEAGKSNNLKFIKGHIKTLCNFAINNIQLLNIILENKFLTGTYYDMYLEKAKGNTEAEAMLLNYKNKNFGDKDKKRQDKKMQDLYDDVFNFDDWE